MDPRIEQTIDFMRQDLSRKLTESELADKIGVSPQHLCALFKSEIGETPVRYLNKLRMNKARELLEDETGSALSIKEIAARVGCRDLSHFVRDFQQRFGLSPRRFRERNQSGSK
jgi:AraC family transcriptional regulator, arabinose operon regulatory protein